jgi:hypothetical protein
MMMASGQPQGQRLRSHAAKRQVGIRARGALGAVDDDIELAGDEGTAFAVPRDPGGFLDQADILAGQAGIEFGLGARAQGDGDILGPGALQGRPEAVGHGQEAQQNAGDQGNGDDRGQREAGALRDGAQIDHRDGADLFEHGASPIACRAR